MRKIIESVGKISKFLAIPYAIFAIAYFAFLLYFEKSLPLPLSIQIENIYVRLLAVGFFILIPGLLISNLSKVFRILIFFLAIPFCCVFSYILLLEFPIKETLRTVDFDNHRYYITVESEIAKPHTIYKTYKCDKNGLHCQVVFNYRSGSTVDDVDFVVNENKTALHVLQRGVLVYTHGAKPWEVVSSLEQGDFTYYIGIYPPYSNSDNQRTYGLYECKNSLVSCEQLPFQYTKFGYLYLRFDEGTDELIIYEHRYQQDEVIIYSYGSEPKCFVEQCTIPSK